MKVCGACEFWVPQHVETCPKCGQSTADPFALAEPQAAPAAMAVITAMVAGDALSSSR